MKKADDLKQRLEAGRERVSIALAEVEAAVKQIEKFCEKSSEYDVFLGREIKLWMDDVVKNARKVFILEVPEREMAKAQKKILANRGDVGFEKFSFDRHSRKLIDAKPFAQVVKFIGFCDECYRDEFQIAERIAQELGHRGLFVLFGTNHCLNPEDLCLMDIRGIKLKSDPK